MASIFSFQEEPPRIHSPWSTPGNTTPRIQTGDGQSSGKASTAVAKLEPERQDGPCEYKLHLLLRPRRKFASTSTTLTFSGSMHSKPPGAAGAARSLSEALLQRQAYQPSPQSRQSRLQQLTTQLLWRLQQSSPFHSSSNADLVLPVLPEATPKLGVPERPAKLLPGLEESQGALYEIGVADDGTLVGLVDDELEESLTNLRAMAASLGCVVDILRRVPVGVCEWAEAVDDTGADRLHREQLLVAEVLVRPDSSIVPEVVLSLRSNDGQPVAVETTAERVAELKRAKARQMRVALAGASTAGKSSLLGTLTTSVVDNGRGKSRLSLLKHRHEIASGVTSSVAQELVGYSDKAGADEHVINYASGDISSWPDIHNLADRLVFFSDSPGLSRYAKSAFRSLISWKPNWTVYCVAADDSEEGSGRNSTGSLSDMLGSNVTVDLSLAHLQLCLRLHLPLVVAITKMDLATKSGLRLVLSKILSALKTAGRKPVLLTSSSVPVPSFSLDVNDALPDLQHISEAERKEVDGLITSIRDDADHCIVPIIMTSAASGSGIGKLHALLRFLPIGNPAEANSLIANSKTKSQILFDIDEVFSIPPSRVYSSDGGTGASHLGVVLCGHVQRGKISVGDQLCLGPFLGEEGHHSTAMGRSKSYSAHEVRQVARSLPDSFVKSFRDDGVLRRPPDGSSRAFFLPVRVVSLRNLRLPVLSMYGGETGTIGVEPIAPDCVSLRKARKGMVLRYDESTAWSSFTASFPSSDFADASSPPLILGGHAILYVRSIRTAVKVTAVALAEEDMTESPSSPVDVFTFDADTDGGVFGLEVENTSQETDIKITFRFGSTVEWMELGDQVLIVPTVTASGPITGPPVATTGLSGFVGRVTDVHP